MNSFAHVPAATQKARDQVRDRAFPAKTSKAEQKVHEAKIQLVGINPANCRSCQISHRKAASNAGCCALQPIPCGAETYCNHQRRKACGQDDHSVASIQKASGIVLHRQHVDQQGKQRSGGCAAVRLSRRCLVRHIGKQANAIDRRKWRALMGRCCVKKENGASVVENVGAPSIKKICGLSCHAESCICLTKELAITENRTRTIEA